MKNRISTLLTWTGMALLLVGILIPLITGPQNDIYKYIFGAGAALNLAGRLMAPAYNGPFIRVKRLLRIEIWASLFFAVSVYFMFTDPNPRSWITFVLAGGAILAYTSIMIPLSQKNKK